MRNALFVFLLINLLAFAYQKWILSPDEPVEADYLDQGFPELAKIEAKTGDEADPDPELLEAEGGLLVDPDADLADMICKRIGPFTREEDAEKVSRALQPEVRQVSLSSEAGEVWAGFWVQAPAGTDYETAENIRKKLIGDGMQDAYIISEGGWYSVSLGVFRLTQSTGKVIAKASALGIQTEIRDRYEEGTNYWLNVSMSDNEELSPGLWQTKSSPILRTEPVSCEEQPV